MMEPRELIARNGHLLVTIPAGSFLMGAGPEDQLFQGSHDELADARPCREVWLDEYLIDKYPVTNEQYRVFLRDLVQSGRSVQEYLPSGWTLSPIGYERLGSKWPVVGISWYSAVAYASHFGMRLPTEAEWEKAARGTDGRKFPWGDDEKLSRYAHFRDCSEWELTESPFLFFTNVDEYPEGVSPYGCFDMLGNAEQWCADYYWGQAYSRLPSTNPVLEDPRDSRHRVIRGCDFGWKFVHIAKRFAESPEEKWSVGFRCAHRHLERVGV